MNNKDEVINISIRIANTWDHDKVSPGRTYNFDVTRNTGIKELHELFINIFPEELRDDIERYRIFTQKMGKLHNDNSIIDCFTNRDDCYLDIVDKCENLLYAVYF